MNNFIINKLPCVIRKKFTDEGILDMVEYWFEHYKSVGDSHYNYSNHHRILAIYWGKIIDRVLEDLDTELTDNQIERVCNWINNNY